MQTSKLIGSILTLKPEGITQCEISIIKEYSDKHNLNLLSSPDLSTIVYELYDYDDCFYFLQNQIKMTEYYFSNISRFKNRFFNVLTEYEKNIIYDLLNIL